MKTLPLFVESLLWLGIIGGIGTGTVLFTKEIGAPTIVQIIVSIPFILMMLLVIANAIDYRMAGKRKVK